MYEVHKSVLVNEVIEYLNIRSGSKIVDATLDGGGHTKAILEKYPDVKVLGIERDPELVKSLNLEIENLKIVNDSYVNLENIVQENNFKPDAILFDLGLSSWHYEKSGRGFSFKKDEPLDMRFNPESGGTAADVLNNYNQKDLENILINYGEEKFAESISKNIVKLRESKPILTTNDLVGVVGQSVPEWYKHRKIHFATKTFQALRIIVNNELENVEKGVQAAINVLNKNGRLAVISFHGLEDKIVREIFKNKAKEGIIKWVVRSTIKPKWEEVKENPRARSAKMKVIEKLVASL